jgi:hypothetical protein
VRASNGKKVMAQILGQSKIWSAILDEAIKDYKNNLRTTVCVEDDLLPRHLQDSGMFAGSCHSKLKLLSATLSR